MVNDTAVIGLEIIRTEYETAGRIGRRIDAWNTSCTSPYRVPKEIDSKDHIQLNRYANNHVCQSI